MKSDQRLNFLLWTGFILFAIPFLIYGVALSTGSIPSEEAWAAQANNHGPWRGQWQSWFLYFPLVLPFLTLMVIVWEALQRNFSFIGQGFWILLTQTVMGLIPLLSLYWTVE